MRVLIYGGRDFASSKEALHFLDHIFHYELADWSFDEITVVSGGARGADRVGEEAAHAYGAQLEVFPANWKEYGKAAGAIRNKQMLDSGVDVAVQFPGGNGTAHMRSLLDKAGVRVYEFKENKNASN